MWTRKSCLIYIYLKINCVRIPLIIPIRLFWELVDALDDLLIFSGRVIAGVNVRKILWTVIDAVNVVTALGSFDLVEVEAEKVIVKVCLR